MAKQKKKIFEKHQEDFFNEYEEKPEPLFEEEREDIALNVRKEVKINLPTDLENYLKDIIKRHKIKFKDLFDTTENHTRHEVLFNSLKLFDILYPIDKLPADIYKFIKDKLVEDKKKEYKQIFKQLKRENE